MDRMVICPFCGHSIPAKEQPCFYCSGTVAVAEHDFQDVLLESTNDGYHSWYSQPTAYHMIYRCMNYPRLCKGCINEEGTLCRNGKIVIRVARRETSHSISYQWDYGTDKYWDDDRK